MRDLISGATYTFAANSVVDAFAQYQLEVEGNLLVWEEVLCVECGHAAVLGGSTQHGSACSLYTANCVD
ncbi:hypothetical protein [Mycobacterium paragordonae]|uniref:Uncharacterized protein n=1 Tax=Mycobacterium paragordonae TaxID=1389713 RepID=A0AAJ1SBQ4_9MYCO|nr:hypothetical protein [Mycobacterium paragordonae]MDP7739612.1 hypothetical protein [Mycobacterium paragordonae]